MNPMYKIPMGIKQEILNNQFQFNRQIKRKIQQGRFIPMFTKCEENINQQT